MKTIRTTINKFANSFDRKDWEGLTSVLAGDVQCDYSGLRGSAETVSRESYVSKRIMALDHLQMHHVFANHQIVVEDNQARCVTSAVIWRRHEDKVFNTHAIYTFGLKQENGDWKISSIKQEVLWNEGDASIHAGANDG